MDFTKRAMERVRLSYGTLQKHTMAKNVTELQSMIFEDITSNTQLQTLTMSQFDHVVVQLETATSIRSNIVKHEQKTRQKTWTLPQTP